MDRERAEYERLRAHAREGERAAAGHGHGHDTVGAIALDAAGHVAAATSTGGKTFKPVGRVGNSPLVGSGGYADDELGAVSCTGDGEWMPMKLVLGKWAVDRIGDGMDPQDAAAAAIQRLATRLGATAAHRPGPRWADWRCVQHPDGLGSARHARRARRRRAEASQT